MPQVSIFMPCYNHERYVGEAIQSVLTQSYTDFEFLIVDNGSTDNSYEVIRGFEDERIRIFRLEKNSPAKAEDTFLKNFTGKYVAKICSDDAWEPDKLMKQMTALENNPDIRMSATWSVFAREDLDNLDWSNSIFRQHSRNRTEWIRFLLDNGNCLSLPSLVVKSDLYVKIIHLCWAYWQMTDYFFWLAALAESNIYLVEEVLVRQRLHTADANVSYPGRENNIRAATEKCNILFRMIENMSDDDFREVYADKLINRRADTHLEMMCEKYFVLLGYALQNPVYEDNAINYYFKYSCYEENGVHMYEVLEDVYGYPFTNFIQMTGAMGQVAVRAGEEDQPALQENKICFIIYGDNDFLCQESLHYVMSLNVPEGMELDYMIISQPDSISEAFNAGMAESDAAYKVYVNENVFLTDSQFIFSLMNAFGNNPNVGMLGALGYHEDTSDDNEGKRRIGCVTAEEEESGTQLHFFDCEREYGLREVSELDYHIVATALDTPWLEDADASKVMADKTNVLNSMGYKSVVMLTGGSWCLYDNNIIQKSNG